jgi:hypothetical protein
VRVGNEPEQGGRLMQVGRTDFAMVCESLLQSAPVGAIVNDQRLMPILFYRSRAIRYA